MDQGVSVKRKHTDEPEDETNQKKPKIEDSDSHTDECCYIVQLPECVLTVLFSYFDASSLYSLSQTCQLFHELAKQHRFWRYVDARNAPHDTSKFTYCCKRIHEGTTHFLYKGRSRVVEVLSLNLFNRMDCWSNLKVLALENQYICGNTYFLRSFPKSLEELSLRKTHITNGFNFLRFSSCLERLRVLMLDHCQWFEASNLVSIANLKRLEILSLYKCKRLSDSDISYLSLSGDYGLKSIKILDARFTAVGNQLLSSMYKSPTLQELYFQCYSTTYQLDRTKRKLAIHQGSQQEPHSYMSDEEENLDTSTRRMRSRFGKVPLRMSTTDVVDDGGVAMFKYVLKADSREERPKSYLFKDPYSECKCHYYKTSCLGRRIINNVTTHDLPAEVDDEESSKLKYTIRKRQRQLKKALKHRRAPPLIYVVYNPHWEFNDRMAHFQWVSERAPQNEKEMEMLEHTIVDIPPDEGIIICGNSGSHYSVTAERALFFKTTNSEEVSDKDTSDECSSSSDEESEADRMGYPPGSDPYMRILRCCGPEVKATCRLSRLSLRGYPKVTDYSLRFLRDIDLDLLDVSYTNVTKRGIMDFITTHPNCRVIHESVCTCSPRMHF